MSVIPEAGSSLRFYTGINYSGTSQSVAHGITGTLATGSNSWNYRSVAMSDMHAFCWSEVSTTDPSLNYQNHTESLITADVPDLTTFYVASAFPLSYLGVDPAVVTPVWLDMSAVSGDVNAVAATSVVGGATTSITTLSRPGLNGVAGFIGITTGSSVIVSCLFGAYNATTGQVAWSSLNAGTLVLEYTGGAVTILSATGFPDGWTFAAPVMQTDNSWQITVAGGGAGNVISTLVSDRSSIINDGISAAVLTATVTDGSGLPVSGVTVKWSAAPGELSTSSSVTDMAGQATTTLTDTGDTGTSWVTATLDNGSTKSVSVALLDASGDVTLVSVTSDKDTIINDGEDQAYLTATVVDTAGNPAQGVTVTWTTDLGNLNHKQQVTDETGQSHAKLSDLGDAGTAVVTATLPDGTCKYVNITVEEAEAGDRIVSLISDKASITNDGTDAATLTALVYGQQNMPAAGVRVNWRTTLGNLSSEFSMTNLLGQATVSLTDTGDTGTAVVAGVLYNGSIKSVEIVLNTPTLRWTDVTRALNPLKKITVDEQGIFSTNNYVPVGARVSRKFTGGALPVHWSSSQPGVASVDKNGMVTINGRGIAKISLTDSDNNQISYLINTLTASLFKQKSTVPEPWQEHLSSASGLEDLFDEWGDFYNDANACGWRGQSASNFYFWSATGSDRDPGILVKMAYWTVNLHMKTEEVVDWPDSYHYIAVGVL